MSTTRRGLMLAAVAALVVGACSSTPAASSGAGGGGGGTATKVRFQLQWVAQSQFAGYYAAIDQGYYKEQNLDVQILLGGPDINPMQVVASDGADIGTTWVPKMLASREGGTDLVDIAQIFQRSGTLEVSFKDKNLKTVSALKGKKVGSWLGGNEPELYAALTKVGLNPAKDVTVIKQDFNMSGLLQGDLDAAQAMIYNEFAQVLEAKNQATGQLYQPSDLNIIDFNGTDVATAMLQDMIFARDSWLKKPGNEDVATRFLVASFKGWIYCRDNQDKCVDIVLKNGSKLGASHQAWQLNEINALIWPSFTGIGQLDRGSWAQTVGIATKYGILKAEPSDGAFRTDLAKKANDLLGDKVDRLGRQWVKAKVTLTEGGA